MLLRAAILLALTPPVAIAFGLPAGAVQRVQAEQQIEPFEAVFACHLRARDDTLLRAASVDELCEGAADASPVACYLEARARTFLSVDDAISLCRCATSTAPVECFRAGHRTTRLGPSRILALCSPTEQLDLDERCAPSR